MKLQSTFKWAKWWQERKIDWHQAYLSTATHPHRFWISKVLSEFFWISLIEIGSGPGANLVNIFRSFGPTKQLGGVDINPDAIKLAEENFKGGLFRVGNFLDIPLSDNSSDVVLTDMTLIYAGPRKIHIALEELKRVSRRYVVMFEFHSESLWDRVKLYFRSGYFAYNYKKLLEKHGYYDIILQKMPKECWDGDPQRTYAYLIKAKVLKRK